jgi:hypothetical protein
MPAFWDFGVHLCIINLCFWPSRKGLTKIVGKVAFHLLHITGKILTARAWELFSPLLDFFGHSFYGNTIIIIFLIVHNHAFLKKRNTFNTINIEQFSSLKRQSCFHARSDDFLIPIGKNN